MGCVADWLGQEDPAELILRLDVVLAENAELRDEIGQLRADNVCLRRALESDRAAVPGLTHARDAPRPRPRGGEGGTGLPYADADSPADAKIALFRALFVGREDVYARRWVSRKSGRTGWSPAEDNPFEKNKDESRRRFWPLTDQVLRDHLSQTDQRHHLHAGLYPLLLDDSCRVLVCDFDGKDGSDWQGGAAAYVTACREAGVPVRMEISRSGAGAHVWMFFSDPVASAQARALGMGLLRKALETRGCIALSSYDRFFPAQDAVPSRARGNARFGNVIALPLQGECRTQGTTVFCDPDTWQPYPDQFAVLSGTDRLSSAEVLGLVDTLGEVTVGPGHSAPALLPTPPGTEGSMVSGTVPVRLSGMLAVGTGALPPRLLTALKHAATLHNPEFYRRQNQRFSTWNTPRFVRSFDATNPHWLKMPRGLLDEVVHRIESVGGAVEIIAEFPPQNPIEVQFTGTLTTPQREAVAAMARHRTGVLVAPPGAGKTVVACALIAEHAVPTAIIVNRAELLDQWREQLVTFLNLGGQQVGSLGAGKDRRTQTVDVIMLQTLTHRDAREGLLDEYGLVIVDECHVVGAPATETALRTVPVERWVGLSATPYRADQMNGLITMQCGPIRHEIPDTSAVSRYLVVHRTEFSTDEPVHDGTSIQAIYNELAHDANRNARIASDIAEAAARGRCCLVLTNRIEHLHQLAHALRPHGLEPLLLHGDMTSAQRQGVRDALTHTQHRPTILLAIDKLAGQGFDAPRLDTVFLASPISFKGRVIQQVGRILREADGTKDHVETHDYLDAEVAQLSRMQHKRRRILEHRGFTTVAPSTVQTPISRAAPDVPQRHPSTPPTAPVAPPVSKVRAWARDRGYDVAPRGRLRAEIWNAWHATHARPDHQHNAST